MAHSRRRFLSSLAVPGLLVGAAPALLTFLIRLFVPESHAWQAAQTAKPTKLCGKISSIALELLSLAFANERIGLGRFVAGLLSRVTAVSASIRTSSTRSLATASASARAGPGRWQRPPSAAAGQRALYRPRSTRPRRSGERAARFQRPIPGDLEQNDRLPSLIAVKPTPRRPLRRSARPAVGG